MDNSIKKHIKIERKKPKDCGTGLLGKGFMLTVSLIGAGKVTDMLMSQVARGTQIPTLELPQPILVALKAGTNYGIEAGEVTANASMDMFDMHTMFASIGDFVSAHPWWTGLSLLVGAFGIWTIVKLYDLWIRNTISGEETIIYFSKYYDKRVKKWDRRFSWEYAKEAAIEDLENLGNKKAIPFLKEMLSDDTVYIDAARALETLGATDSQLVDGYIKVLTTSGLPAPRQYAVDKLEAMGIKKVIPLLLECLSDSYVRVTRALKTLGATDDQLIAGYIVALSSGSGVARRRATKALKKLGASDDQMVSVYIKALSSGNKGVVGEAVVALGKLGYDRAVPHLIMILDDKSSEVKEAAVIEALEKLGKGTHPKVLEAKKKILEAEEKEWKVREWSGGMTDLPQSSGNEYTDPYGDGTGYGTGDSEEPEQPDWSDWHTGMGRWESEGLTFDPKNNTVTLHKVKRIARKDGVIEPEFASYQKEGKDIVLNTRELNETELEKIKSIIKELGMKEELRAIIRDDSAIKHRITGIGFFDKSMRQRHVLLREDILKPEKHLKGVDKEWWDKLSPQKQYDMKKEALHHETLHAMHSEWTHDDIRYNRQFQGGYTSLSTRLIQNDKVEYFDQLVHDYINELSSNEFDVGKKAVEEFRNLGQRNHPKVLVANTTIDSDSTDKT